MYYIFYLLIKQLNIYLKVKKKISEKIYFLKNLNKKNLTRNFF